MTKYKDYMFDNKNQEYLYIDTVNQLKEERKKIKIPPEIWYRVINTIETKKHETYQQQFIPIRSMVSVLKFSPAGALGCIATIVFLNVFFMNSFMNSGNEYLNSLYFGNNSQFLIDMSVFSRGKI